MPIIENSHEHIVPVQGKRILYLTKDPSQIEKQLKGDTIEPVKEGDLLNGVSTDAYPTKACFRFDKDYMASKALTGLSLNPNYPIPDNAIKEGGFNILVAGSSFGCGSSREHFPWSLKAAGIELIIASSIEKICAQNCQNIGLPYIEGDPYIFINRLLREGSIPFSELIKSMDPISAQIVKSGGLFPFFKQNLKSIDSISQLTTGTGPMTGPEKIIAKHMGVNYVRTGDTGFIPANRRYSYEIFSPFSDFVLHQEVPDAKIEDPQSVYLFYDHSPLDESPDAISLGQQTRQIAHREGFTFYDGDKENGVEGICHTLMLNHHALPGEIILGTDSHTCTLGAIGALSIGIGATEMAAALWTNRARICVPSSINFELLGTPPQGTMAKDIMLHILSHEEIKKGSAIGKIFVFSGETLDFLPFDEQVVLSNMAVEGGGSGFVEPNKVLIKHVMDRHHLATSEVEKMLSYSDLDAKYDRKFIIDTSKLEPYISLPGDPRNALPLSKLLEEKDIYINKAFIGSCTGGKYWDLIMAARVLSGQRIHPDVELFVSASSREIYSRLQKEGIMKIFEDAGAHILPSACGACVNFGPGSVNKGEVGISSTNRNFPGRMGQGDVFLSNPAIVAASAIKGKISSFTTL